MSNVQFYDENPGVMPIDVNTYDITIDLSGDKVSLVGLYQAEIMRFMSLMPKMIIKRYSKDVDIPKWVMSVHKDTDDVDDK